MHFTRAPSTRRSLTSCAYTRLAVFALACFLLLSFAYDTASIDAAAYASESSTGLVKVASAMVQRGPLRFAVAAEEPAEATAEVPVEVIETATVREVVTSAVAEPASASTADAPVREVPLEESAEEQSVYDAAGNFDDAAEAEAYAAKAAATAAKEQAEAPLEDLSDDALKKLLTEKKNGNVNLKHFSNRTALLDAIRVEERREAAQRAFRAEVAAAAHWYAEHREEELYEKAATRRAKSSRIKRGGTVPAALRKRSLGEPEHELRVVYNDVSAYSARFAQMQQDLETSEDLKLPNLASFRIVGEIYPISPNRALLAQVLQGLFFFVLILAVIPDMIPFIPEVVRNVVRTRRGLVLSTAFVLNTFSSSVKQNSAFEVYLDNELIYSALKMGGRLPATQLVNNMVLERTLLKEYREAMARKAGAAY